MLDKKCDAKQFLTTADFIFQKYIHCGMHFLFVKISALPCILNGVGIGVSVISN